jgi:hypothetical protein
MVARCLMTIASAQWFSKEEAVSEHCLSETRSWIDWHIFTDS